MATVPTTPAARPDEADAIDLIAVTGVGPAARRALPYALGLLAAAVLVWIVLRRRR